MAQTFLLYVLASAFVDGENIIPVKLEVKEFSDKENTLYVAIALESIKKNEIVKQEVATNGVAQQYSPSFNISIADFLRKINPSDESFYKYIPKKLLETSKDGNGQVLNVKSNDSPQPTSKTLLDGITATDSITKKLQIVNSNSKKGAANRAADIADHDGNTSIDSITEKSQTVNSNSEKSAANRAADIADRNRNTFEGERTFTEELSAPTATSSDNRIFFVGTRIKRKSK